MGKERVIVKTDEDLSQVAETAKKLKLVNRDLTSGSLVKELGLDVTRRGEQVPESGGVPGMFLLKDGKISTLEENGVEVGSQKFWQEAVQGPFSPTTIPRCRAMIRRRSPNLCRS